MSRDYPAQYGRSPQYYNPDGTIPAPRGKNIPETLWTAQADVDWGNAANVADPHGHQWTFRWSTTLFDLKPQLRSAHGPEKQGYPVWNRGARLFIVLATSPTTVAFPASGLAVTATDFVALNQVPVGPRPGEGFTAYPGTYNVATNDVTAQFTPTPAVLGAPQAIQTGFAPPGTNLGFGDGHPLRYWRLEFTFTFTNETGLPIPAPPAVGAAGAPPFMQLTASMF